MVGRAKLALGTVQWGQRYGVANQTGQPREPEVAAMLQLARQHGVNTLDTARSYGDSETVIGALTAGQPGWRIVTKLAHDVHQDAASIRQRVEASITTSLRALRLGRLDTLLLHRAEQRHAPLLWDYLCELRDAGRIDSLGVSAADPEEAWQALEDPQVRTIQVASSLLDQRLVRTGFFAQAGQLSKEIFVRSVFLQGVAFLHSAQLPAHLALVAPVLRQIEAWAQAHDANVADIFLKYALRIPAGYVLIGCERLTQLAHNLDVARQATDPDSLAELAATLPRLDSSVLDPALWPKTC